ncbi:hypothetical protein CK203_079524 [Vitis vinifera]|uniref:Uncharacterized protein n=1 Tax=Vitis vinifera TaxID=29760 RepID=A0A438CNZ5_VITVI|nr:hypothetical protein CK203_079524 [Vitis vinifera]
MRARLDAPPHLADSASQSRYHTRRASATPVTPTQIPPRGPPTKKAKTSEPGESSRAPRDSQSQPPSTRRPRPSSPIEANSDCHPKHFISRHILITLFCASRLTCRDSYSLLRVYDYSWHPGTSLDTFLPLMDARVFWGARQIAEAFHIPYAPADPTAFRRWAPLSEWDMVRSLS